MVKESLIKKLMEMEIGELRERLEEIFAGSGVDVWDCDFVM